MRIRLCGILVLGLLALAGCSKRSATDDLISDLSSKEEGDRLKAVRLLPQRKGEAAKIVPALTKSLEDHEADIRWSAAIGLGYFGKQAESAVPALEGLERDSDARVREAARVAISRINGK